MGLLIVVVLFSQTGKAQSTAASQQANRDSNALVTISYPPLTSREGKGLQIPLPPVEHPRLFLNKKDIPVLKSKATSPLLKECWNRIVKASTLTTNGHLLSNNNNLDVDVRNAIEAKALMYLLSGDTSQGKNAVEAIINFYATLKIDMTKADVTRDVGRAIVTGAIVYDWCYPLLNAAQKQLLIGRMESLAVQMEIKWPLLSQSSVTGHGAEAQVSRDMLSCGVATYNEKPEIYNLAAGRIIAEFAPARKFFYPAAYHHQGSAYGPYRFSWDMIATIIFDKLGYPSIFGNDQAKAPYYFIYSRRPDGQLFRNGDDFNELFIPFGKYWNFGSTSNSYAGSYFKDPILYHEALKEGALGKDADYIFDFLFCDGDFTAGADKASLPLTKYFKEPFGAMIARTGWEEGPHSSSVVAEMKVGAYNFVNHQHLDAGSFQLYYKGPLAVQSGIYQGTNGGYGSDHFINYSQRTIAHNTLLVYDSSEQFTWQRRPIINDGGQKYPNGGAEPKNLEDFLTGVYKTGEVLAHAFGPDSLHPAFSYLKGELAAAYSGKVKSCTRSFVFLQLNDTSSPAALIVYDKIISTSENFKPYWLLHCVEEPVIKDIYTTIARTEKGYNGKLINTTLLPDIGNLSINKVGGKGNEYNVFGKNFPQSLARPAAGSADSAVWRIEISPSKPSIENNFLNVMQVMNNNGDARKSTTAPKKIETDKLTGVEIEDRIILFSKSGNIITNEIELNIKGNGDHKVLITDLQPGNWKIAKAGNKSFNLLVRNTDQLIYFTVNAGDYVISKK